MTSSLRAFALCVTIYFLRIATCAGQDVPSGDSFVPADDPRVQYNPSLSTPGVWSEVHPHKNENGWGTSDVQANVSFTVQGSSIQYYIFAEPDVPPLIIMLDNTVIMQPDSSNLNPNDTSKVYPFSVGGSSLNAFINHTVVLKMAENASGDSRLNILGFSYAPPTNDLPTLGPTFSLAESSAAATVNAPQTKTRRVSRGAIAGIVIGLLSAIGLAGAFVILCHRRRNMISTAPEPLVISPSEPRPDRTRFQRLYSNFPHFSAPSSIWPTSAVRTSPVDAPAFPPARESIHEKITPFSLPAIPPRVVAPSPPKRIPPRQPKFSSFFVMNPSSHSSRSRCSQSLQDQQAADLDLLAADESIPQLREANEKGELGEQRISHLQKGKQRAVDFEIGPAPPARSKMTRKQSLRRFFFTTNPSPSTSSGSSTTSSQRTRKARRAAVADYVRDQMRRRQHTKVVCDSPNPPLPDVAEVSLLPVSIPDIEIPPSALKPLVQNPPVQQPPKKRRSSQVRFYTTNPNPSMYEVASDNAEIASEHSEIPPPRKDKGKGRAF